MDVSPPRTADVGGLEVRRSLPQRGRRTVGPWCFVDHFGPTDPADDFRMMVGPHPHIGLSTVTWLLEGEAVHTDSLGSEQAIRPGQLNLMTAGNGIAHAEETPVGRHGTLHGVQFWVAQPEATRHGRPAFEHHGELPDVVTGGAAATVLVGSFLGATSPARVDSPMVGVDLRLAAGRTELPLDPMFEHALVPLDGQLRLGGVDVAPDSLAHLPLGQHSITIETLGLARALLIGGEPFEAPVQMWWNFVGRTREEMTLAVEDWNAGSDRFGEVRSDLGRISAPVPAWRDRSA